MLADPASVFRSVTQADPARWYPRFGPLPAVVEVVDRRGDFTVPGDSRRLRLSDGGGVVETLRESDAPRRFVYTLSWFERLFGRLVDSAVAEWTFTPVDAGTRVHWRYTFMPKRGAGPVVRLIVALFWARYMRRVLPPIARDAGPLA